MEALVYIVAGVALLPAACLLEAAAGLLLIAFVSTFIILPYKLARRALTWISKSMS